MTYRPLYYNMVYVLSAFLLACGSPQQQYTPQRLQTHREHRQQLIRQTIQDRRKREKQKEIQRLIRNALEQHIQEYHIPLEQRVSPNQ